MEGKFKISQDVSDGDVDGVVQGFRSLDTNTREGVASLVEQRRETKVKKQAFGYVTHSL